MDEELKIDRAVYKTNIDLMIIKLINDGYYNNKLELQAAGQDAVDVGAWVK